MLFSGGDDSALIASTIDLPNPTAISPPSDEDFDSTANLAWKDRRNHGAGVVSILPLPPFTIPLHKGSKITKTIIPLLTGSYDEHLRVFELDTQTYRAKIQTEEKSDGGVWRLKILDQYTTLHNENGDTIRSQNDPTIPEDEDSEIQHHTLILASLMHAGAMILRLSHTNATSESPSESPWTIHPLSRFRSGHESMVYSCDARLDNPAPQDVGEDDPFVERYHIQAAKTADPRYTVVSTSFYDRKICTWGFVDGFKGKAIRRAVRERGS
jgi:hypothetical protein